jgi:hypothetical protein
VEISQSITKAAYIQNTGTQRVFFDNESSVSQNSYANILDPGSTMNWPANETLWAITAGPLGMLSVLYGAEGAGVGNVTATINGPVDTNVLGTVPITGNVTADIPGTVNVAGAVTVSTPVSILGRGRYVANGTIALTAANFYQNSVVITGLPGTQVGNSLRLIIQTNNAAAGAQTEQFVAWDIAQSGRAALANGGIKIGPATTTEFDLGNVYQQDIGFSFSGTYPLTLSVSEVGIGSSVAVNVLWSLYEVAGDQGFIDYNVQNLISARLIIVAAGPLPNRIYFPPSVRPLRFQIVQRAASTITTTNINIYGDPAKGIASTSFVNWHYVEGFAGGLMTGPCKNTYTIPGTNWPTGIGGFVFGTTTGNIEITLLGPI